MWLFKWLGHFYAIMQSGDCCNGELSIVWSRQGTILLYIIFINYFYLDYIQYWWMWFLNSFYNHIHGKIVPDLTFETFQKSSSMVQGIIWVMWHGYHILWFLFACGELQKHCSVLEWSFHIFWLEAFYLWLRQKIVSGRYQCMFIDHYLHLEDFRKGFVCLTMEIFIVYLTMDVCFSHVKV